MPRPVNECLESIGTDGRGRRMCRALQIFGRVPGRLTRLGDLARRLQKELLAAIIVASPLIHAQLSTGFYLPQTLSALSHIEDLSNTLARLLSFVANPLFFVSPLLLYLLYRGFGHSLKERDLQTLLPALCTIGAFLFFALARGQIKGNFEFMAASGRFNYTNAGY